MTLAGARAMRLNVQLTYDEFAEAAAAIRNLQINALKKKERRSPTTIVTAVVLVVLFVPILSAVRSLFDATPDARPHWYGIVLVTAPLSALFVYAVATTVAQQSASLGRFAVRLLWAFVPLVLSLAAIVALFALARTPRTAPQSVDWFGIVAPHAVWYAVVMVFLVISIIGLRRRYRLAWDAQPGLARPQSFDITSAGVTIDEGVSHRQYTWPAFVRFMETPHLLLLCPSDVTFEMIPKRCFATPEDMNAVRELFAREIRDRTKEAAAFPVLPVSPAPIPPPIPPPLPPSVHGREPSA